MLTRHQLWMRDNLIDENIDPYIVACLGILVIVANIMLGYCLI